MRIVERTPPAVKPIFMFHSRIPKSSNQDATGDGVLDKPLGGC